MSFWPFPKTLLAELQVGLERGPGVELGSGDGQLRDRLASVGVALLTTDLSAPCEVRLDATRLPFLSSRLGLVVAGNLMRHLGSASRSAMLHETVRTLRPGGRMLILEDDPLARSRAEANYRDSLELLARADPSRGAVVDLGDALVARPAELAEVVWSGVVDNEERLHDPLAPANWLVAQGSLPIEEVAAHREEVRARGMDYGRFQACVLLRADRTVED